jgi:HAE1 family hydrophobic/amphiphilic exporter-1
MTTIAAFAPMLLVSGILGEYVSILPKTISVTLISSLFIAIIAIPTLVTRFIKIKNNGNKKHRNKKRHVLIDEFFQKIYKKYEDILRNILPFKKKRRKLIALGWIAFIIALIIPISGLMKIEMFPQIDLDYFLVNIELPVGANLEKTQIVTKQVEKEIALIKDMDNYVSNVGSGGSFGFGGDSGGNGTHLSNITVNLIDKSERKKKSYEIAEDLRKKISSIYGAKITVEELSAGPPSGSPLEIRIFGEDMKELAKISEEIISYLNLKSETINIKSNLKNSAGDFTFSINRQKANYYGLDPQIIAGTLRNAIFGISATEINIDGEDIDVSVKYSEDKFNNFNDLENILIPTPKGGNIPVKEVAEINLEPSLLSINRRDGRKVAIVSADLKKEAKLQNILKDFDKFQKEITLPENYEIKVGGEVESITQSFQELFLSMGLAIIFIALILVLMFNSFRQPFIIIFSVPLAFIGVIIGLNVFRQPFSFTVFIGIVSLSGIVVNDAIVLIDKINKNIKNGMEYIDAIIDGGVSRMQPIFLTSITTIAGVFPLIFASELWRGLSISVIFGLMASTVLILFMVPIIYTELCRNEKTDDVGCIDNETR